jgi:hypothetical protein
MKKILSPFLSWFSKHHIKINWVITIILALFIVGGSIGIFKIYNVFTSKILELEKIIPPEVVRSRFFESYLDRVMIGFQLDRVESTILIQSIYDKGVIKYGLPADLLFSLVENESKGNRKAVSNRYAKGILQIMDAEAERNCQKALGREVYDIWDISDNIELGCYILASNLKWCVGNETIAIAIYNGGLNWEKSLPYSEIVVKGRDKWK